MQHGLRTTRAVSREIRALDAREPLARREVPLDLLQREALGLGHARAHELQGVDRDRRERGEEHRHGPRLADEAFQRVARHGEEQRNNHIGKEVRLDGKRDGLPAHLEREQLRDQQPRDRPEGDLVGRNIEEDEADYKHLAWSEAASFPLEAVKRNRQAQ